MKPRPSILVVLALAACDEVFGSDEVEVVVSVDRRSPAPPAPNGPMSAGEAHDAAERVRALLVLGDARSANEHCKMSLVREGGEPRDRALLLFRCARCARALGEEARARELFERSIALEPRAGPIVARAVGSAAGPPPLANGSLASVRAKLGAMGVTEAARFELVDGPVAVPPFRAVTLERCVEPSDVCEAALVTLSADGSPIDGIRVPFGAFPGSLAAMRLSDPRARVVTWKADVRAELRIGLFLALRVDAGRLTPVALVYSSPQNPGRAEKVRGAPDALVIDEREAPWDVRLRGFRGAPVASAGPPR
ncbi:MAG: tetratricopeptide repeat protein [Deltaproteobacteria bacterium]|nr:tetratricopeptide repeat protein [Deltaproteobacteria bacterium]